MPSARIAWIARAVRDKDVVHRPRGGADVAQARRVEAEEVATASSRTRAR